MWDRKYTGSWSKEQIFVMNLHFKILRIFWLLAIWRYFGKFGSKRNKMFHTRVFVIKHERHDTIPIQNYYIFYICKGQIRKFWFQENENWFQFALWWSSSGPWIPDWKSRNRLSVDDIGLKFWLYNYEIDFLLREV